MNAELEEQVKKVKELSEGRVDPVVQRWIESEVRLAYTKGHLAGLNSALAKIK